MLSELRFGSFLVYAPRGTSEVSRKAQGATLLGAATRLQQTFPQATVFAFALVRTLGFVEDIDGIVEPAVGTVTLRGDEAVREP